MKESFLKIIGFFIRIGVMLFALFLALNLIKESFPKEEIQKGFEEMKEKVEEPLKETEKSIGSQVNLPENGLKLNTQVEVRATTTVSFSFSAIVDGNELYWKIKPENIPQNRPGIFQFFQPLIFDWKKTQIKEEELKELEELKEIFEKKSIFKRFEKIGDRYEFEIDKENLKSGLSEWKREIQEKDIEEFLESAQNIVGRIFVDEKNFAKKVEIEGNSFKIVSEIENLEEEISRKETEEMDFEKFLISIFENLLFI
jgi:hypothetical protein